MWLFSLRQGQQMGASISSKARRWAGVGSASMGISVLAPGKETAHYLVEDKHADYLSTAVKDNQPGLFAALDALDWQNAPAAHTALDRGHGRDETRTIQVLPAPRGPVPLRAQAFLIERTVRDPDDGQLRSSVAAFGITSRTVTRSGTPEVIVAAARGHLDIEALHYATRPCAKMPGGSAPGHHPRSWPPSAFSEQSRSS